MIFHRIDLSAVRRDASGHFHQWTHLIETGQFIEAKKLRLRRLWPFIKGRFECDASGLPGVYMFSDNSSTSGWGSITYFGQTAGTLRERLDHYVREDSCWDHYIVERPDRLREVALTRLRPVMPSTPETLEKHIIKHENALRKTRGCSLFVAGFEEADIQAIMAVEAALIAVSWNCGAPLENDTLEKLPRGLGRLPVLAICESIFHGWNRCGLNEELTIAGVQAFRSASRATIE